MAKLEHLLPEKDAKKLESIKTKTPKHSIKRQLFSTLLNRVANRGNLMVEMDNHFIKRIRISIKSNSNTPQETPFIMHLWVKPIVRPNGRHLLLKIEEPKVLRGYIERASNIFGDSINYV